LDILQMLDLPTSRSENEIQLFRSAKNACKTKAEAASVKNWRKAAR